MKLIHLALPNTDAEASSLVTSEHPDVQELLSRFHANQEMDCVGFDDGHLEFIGTIYMEVVRNPNYSPTPEIQELIRHLNARMDKSCGEPSAELGINK